MTNPAADSVPIGSSLSPNSSSTTVVQASTIPENGNMQMIKCDSMVECAGCGSHIFDRYYLSAVDQHWHVSCLKCSQCKVNLQAEPSCFSRDGLIFCKSDYYRLFTMRRCNRCGEGIYASELVMRVRDHNVYHLQCFTCAWCNVTLAQGDLFGVRDNLVYCRNHYEMLSTNNGQIGNPPLSPIRCYESTSTPPPQLNSTLYSSSLGSISSTPSDLLNRHHHMQTSHPVHHYHHHHSHSSSSSSPNALHHYHNMNQSFHHQVHLGQHHHSSGPLSSSSPPSASIHLNDSHLMGDICSTMAATPYPSTGQHHLPYSPLSITNLSSGGGGGSGSPATPVGGGGGSSMQNSMNGQSPSTTSVTTTTTNTGQSIRKGRPRKRKNVTTSNHQHHQHNHHHHQQQSQLSNSPHSHGHQQQHHSNSHSQSDPESGAINSLSHESLSSPPAPSSRNAHSPVLTNSLDGGGGPLSGLAASIENSCNSQLASSALNSLSSHQSLGSSGNGGNSSNQRTKRMRTSFKHHQLRTMKSYFGINQNPDAKDLKALAQKTGLSKRVLQVWFQNARAKWRRNNLKMMPDTQHELGLNGQTMLNTAIGSHNPSTPSTIISSPSGSTRPYSSPSPAALSPPSSVTADTSSLSHQAAIISVSNAVATAGGPSPQSIPSSKSNLQEAAAFNIFQLIADL
ncbi:lim/homeobox protein lhx9-like protein [Dermatophagoides farinae]|uniref:Lim/homeobox protein lhx9-like protein n=1 Tax=Dermatophagoides farinae TaxID=6954 RepID=A0A9D4NQR1_DERFA|nr:lim/homeobox protein lhx9-like protein [Dermatophagoides farinae]